MLFRDNIGIPIRYLNERRYIRLCCRFLFFILVLSCKLSGKSLSSLFETTEKRKSYTGVYYTSKVPRGIFCRWKASKFRVVFFFFLTTAKYFTSAYVILYNVGSTLSTRLVNVSSRRYSDGYNYCSRVKSSSSKK